MRQCAIRYYYILYYSLSPITNISILWREIYCEYFVVVYMKNKLEIVNALYWNGNNIAFFFTQNFPEQMYIAWFTSFIILLVSYIPRAEIWIFSCNRIWSLVSYPLVRQLKFKMQFSYNFWRIPHVLSAFVWNNVKPTFLFNLFGTFIYFLCFEIMYFLFFISLYTRFLRLL